MGLRYDVDVPRTERYNRLSYWDIDAPSPIAGRVPYLGSKGQHLIDGESNMTFNQLPPSYFALGNQLQSTNQVPNPFFGIITNPTSSMSLPTIAYSQLLRPFPQYTRVNAFRKPQANSLYHSFTLRVEKRFSDGL